MITMMITMMMTMMTQGGQVSDRGHLEDEEHVRHLRPCAVFSVVTALMRTHAVMMMVVRWKNVLDGTHMVMDQVNGKHVYGSHFKSWWFFLTSTKTKGFYLNLVYSKWRVLSGHKTPSQVLTNCKFGWRKTKKSREFHISRESART